MGNYRQHPQADCSTKARHPKDESDTAQLPTDAQPATRHRQEALPEWTVGTASELSEESVALIRHGADVDEEEESMFRHIRREWCSQSD